MEAGNLAIQPIGKHTDIDSIFIANSRFSDDIWDLRPLMPSKTTPDTDKWLRFEYIKAPDLRHIVKLYAYYKLGHCKPTSVKDYVNGFLPRFIKYCEANGIRSFCELTKAHFMDFSRWLNEDNLANSYRGHILHTVEEIIKAGQIKGWNVPQTNIAVLTDNYIRKKDDDKKTKPIPEYVFNRILHHAIHDEQDILVKAGIIIQSQTGLRISEVLSMRKGCIHTTADGHVYMSVTLCKTEKGEPVLHKVFINELVNDTIRELETHTEALRVKSGLQELFLSDYRGGSCISARSWTKSRLSRFVEKWNIRDSKGNLYPLASHQFRATFVRELIKKKVPISHIMKHFSHVSIEMTAHYLTLREEEVKELYSEIVLCQDSKIAGIRATEIKNRLNEAFFGKTEAEVEQVISELSNSMSFNPLPTGICLYDFRRGNCSDGDGCFFYNCPNYITEARFYPVLKMELELMEKEMTRLEELGRERDWQRQYVKWAYLKPLVESLEAQMSE